MRPGAPPRNCWTVRDTIGILIVVGITLSAARSLEGIAQALVVLVGVVVALLWTAKFFFEGYTDAVGSTSPDH
ncbi:hypothetical protein [Natrialbaceae archaeon AArc-T1-2]|uniref:hypothetical protein n=1 Tax=Natrialbaceae archaeon AArc-T1-2 TaxID=3053904 RepID=UPI00255A8130|nr:hypothetical protein [Natrialbaceae archaeon AArc-T1-2]WIV66493.1 hypothetical protein QQ977_12435 [Natrialbaceae archaeon AArc-T1-2]